MSDDDDLEHADDEMLEFYAEKERRLAELTRFFNEAPPDVPADAVFRLDSEANELIQAIATWKEMHRPRDDG
jgi:hypothetical protein